MVRIWIALLHQEKPVHNVYWFFFFGAEEDLNRAAARSAVSNQPGGLLLSPRFPTCRNVYREADCPLSFLFYIFIDCTGVEDALGITAFCAGDARHLLFSVARSILMESLYFYNFLYDSFIYSMLIFMHTDR